MTFQYEQIEINRALTDNDGDMLRLKITGKSGETRWLSITEDNARSIASLLTTESIEDELCLHSWVAGMMYVNDEDLDTVHAARSARGESVECERCGVVYNPRA